MTVQSYSFFPIHETIDFLCYAHFLSLLCPVVKTTVLGFHSLAASCASRGEMTAISCIRNKRMRPSGKRGWAFATFVHSVSRSRLRTRSLKRLSSTSTRSRSRRSAQATFCHSYFCKPNRTNRIVVTIAPKTATTSVRRDFTHSS
jgi:hypothetical protein